MKIILAGLSKTGTKSMKNALEILGYSVYDAEENFDFYNDEWMKIMTVGGDPEDFKRMYKDVDATCDVPACHYWEEIHKAFPQAKIILMLRDSEDEWCESLQNQLKMLSNCGLYNLINRLSPHCSKLQKFLNNSIRVSFGSLPISPWNAYVPNEQALKIAYRNHNARVLQVAPKDSLLVYKCSEGWKKLCKFLECEVPKVEFPHKNKRGSILQEQQIGDKPGQRRIKREITVSLFAAIFPGISYLAYIIATSNSFL